MLLTLLHGAAIATLGIAFVQGSGDTARRAPAPPAAAPRPAPGATPASPATPRPAMDSAAIAARRARSDSVLAHRRRMLDSITAADRAAAALRPSQQNAGPFDEFRWAFYGTLAAGMLMGLAAFMLSHRDAAPAARRLWGLAGAIIGTMIGGMSFATVFIFFGMLSIGFNPTPVPVQFGLALLATAFGISWLMSIRYRGFGRRR